MRSKTWTFLGLYSLEELGCNAIILFALSCIIFLKYNTKSDGEIVFAHFLMVSIALCITIGKPFPSKIILSKGNMYVSFLKTNKLVKRF